jgi:hypothetical protein
VNNVFVVDSQETPGNFVNTKMGVKNMKRTFAISFFVIAALALMVGPATAGKPQNVIEKSNGFPSGMHFNLNIHGKKWETCNVAPDDVWGNSIFIPETGTATIQYVSNKKSSVYELTVLDACAGFGFGGENDVAKIQLPYKVKVNDVPTEAGGFYVFGRILGKPDNGTGGEPSSVILIPNPVLQVCNDPGIDGYDFGSFTDCDDALLALGLVTNSGIYEATQAGFERFDESSESKGKGKSKAKDITGLFLWTGYVCDDSLDIDGPEGVPDGVIDEYDVTYDADLDGDIDSEDLLPWLEQEGSCTFHDNTWIFDLADLVVQDQTIDNDGTKLLQIRFYPVETTEFQPQ